MTLRVWDEEGTFQTETTDTTKIEEEQLTTRDLLVEILLELRKANLHLAVLSGEDVTNDDARRVA
jgi:hypothetical protein